MILAALFSNRNRIQAVVLVKVERALLLVSPEYDTGMTEEEVRSKWQKYYRAIYFREQSDS